MTFEQYLKEQYTDQFAGPLNTPDTFDAWKDELDPADWISFADRYANEQRIELLEKAEKRIAQFIKNAEAKP